MSARITVVGIGEDGLDGIGTDARGCIDAAEILLGGERHLALVPERGGQERLTWGECTSLELGGMMSFLGEHLCKS